MRAKRDRFVRYLQRDGERVSYLIGADPRIVHEVAYRLTLFATQVSASDGARYRHLLVVPLSHGAASFSTALALLEEDSARVDAGDIGVIDRLADAVAWDFRRYRTFPSPLGRFTL